MGRVVRLNVASPGLAPAGRSVLRTIVARHANRRVKLIAGPARGLPSGRGRLPAGESEAAIKEEFGDLLFVMANVARHLKIDPEACLRMANQKFVRRFHYIEDRLTEQGSSPAQSTLEEMDALWDEVRAEDKLQKP